MPSKEVMAYDRWPTIVLYIKYICLRSFLKHGMTACPNCCLIMFTYKGIMGTYFEVETVYQYQDSKLDSLAYRGTVPWNTICLNKNRISYPSNKDVSLIRAKDYFKVFKFDTTSASTTWYRNAISYTVDNL